MEIQTSKAIQFRQLHRGPSMLILPNAWDVASARIFEDAGFPAPKINVVVMRGINDNELLDFAELTHRKAWSIRFIEYMPATMDPEWGAHSIMAPEILERIKSRYALERIEKVSMAGPATNYKIPGAMGEIGVIAPLSSHFCGSCNRLRITATGEARGCLFSDRSIDLKPYLLRTDAELKKALCEAAENKPRQHRLLDSQPQFTSFSMVQIGG